jgi:hypothetical protein
MSFWAYLKKPFNGHFNIKSPHQINLSWTSKQNLPFQWNVVFKNTQRYYPHKCQLLCVIYDSFLFFVFCLVSFMQDIEYFNFHYTNMCQVHYVFHKILNEFEKFYHGENSQPFHEWRSIAIKNEFINQIHY